MGHRMPVLFVSHGAPTFALEPGVAGPELTRLGRHLARPAAVLIVSAHWMSRAGVRVTAAEHPETIHDFRGFPSALYALRYPAPGAPLLAAQLVRQLRAQGWDADEDPVRGLDHGAWVPLMHLLPDADIPVIQVSLPDPCDTQRAWELGRALAPLRDQGVLIVGSGSLTHNLYEVRHPGSDAELYVQEFTGWVRSHVAALDHAALKDYRRLAPAATRAHPTEEHFLPLLVAMGASCDGDPVGLVDGGVDYGVLSMDTYVFGELARAA